MRKMCSQVDTIISAYKTLAKIPALVDGRLNSTGSKITSTWTIRNLDKGKPTKYEDSYVLDNNLNVLTKNDFGVDRNGVLLSSASPRDNFKAVIREEKESKEKKRQFLEVWSRSSLSHSVDLTALDIHGDVYADSTFGSLNWSPDEGSVAYVAERKLKKSEPYIKRQPLSKKGNGDGDDAPEKGEEYAYKQDWGEQLVGKVQSCVVVCRVDTETFTVLEGLPDSWCPGQVRFTPDGLAVVGVAWETEPRRLGLVFCTNRPSYIFHLTLDGKLTRISPEGSAVQSPQYNPAGDLVWLQRPADGPHHACHAIVARKYGQTENVILSDIVNISKEISPDDSYYGMYSPHFPHSAFSADGARLVFSTPQRTEGRAYVLDAATGAMVNISNKSVPQSTSILDVRNDVILASCSSNASPAQLYVARLPPRGKESEIKWLPVSDEIEVPSQVKTATVEYMYLEHKDTDDEIKSFTAILTCPKVEKDKKVPLIVFPHGGPHSSYINAYSLLVGQFTMLGFATVQVNYRGSSGFGRANDYFLPKRVGDTDVKDCVLATQAVLDKHPIDARKLCLFGGSHGGFLVCHLSGQYPDLYCSVVARNPVTDIAPMFNTTDIADWLHSKFFVGFATLRVNFRGSTGAGDANVRCLISHVGDYDVRDCHLALTTLLERDEYTRDSIFLFGGSYGGCTVGHLAAKYPDLFKTVAMRNPLIDLATKGYYADNSDGCAVEAGFEFTEKGPVSEEELLAMRRCSPMAHVHKVKAPTALFLGSGDRRVPPYQGLEYARRLKANGVKSKIYMYDDNHSLSQTLVEMDVSINSCKWFLEHMPTDGQTQSEVPAS